MLYLLGKYPEQEFLPPYLQEKNFDLIKINIDRIKPISADSKYWLEQQPENLFDGMALSNICELMDENDTEKLFQEVIRTSKSGSKIVFRNLMIPRDVPPAYPPKSSKIQNSAKKSNLTIVLLYTEKSLPIR